MRAFSIPPRLAVDADGYCWRLFDDEEHAWSMCPVNPNNEPIPEPVTYYVPVPSVLELRNVIGACALQLEPMTTSDAIARAVYDLLTASAGSTERKA